MYYIVLCFEHITAIDTKETKAKSGKEKVKVLNSKLAISLDFKGKVDLVHLLSHQSIAQLKQLGDNCFISLLCKYKALANSSPTKKKSLQKFSYVHFLKIKLLNIAKEKRSLTCPILGSIIDKRLRHFGKDSFESHNNNWLKNEGLREDGKCLIFSTAEGDAEVVGDNV
jgi:hypothetical protein